MMVSVYSGGTPAIASRGTDHFVREVHCVEDRVRYGDIRRHAHDDDGRRTEVAEDRVDVGARDRPEPVETGGDDVGVGHADRVCDLHHLAADELRAALARHGPEQPGVVVRPSHVGTVHRDVMNDLHPGAPTGVDESSDVVDHPGRARRFCELWQRALRADHAALALLREDRGVSRRDEFAEVRHQRPKSAWPACTIVESSTTTCWVAAWMSRNERPITLGLRSPSLPEAR